MPLVLVIGSHVAASRVGGTMTSLALALSPAKIDPVHVPTTLLGRHPGWGRPGGGSVDAAIMAAMIEGIAANGLLPLFDGVITNYFANPSQVDVAVRAVMAVKAANPKAIIMVDPVMGDTHEGLYVGSETAHALMRDLVPCADVITPNIWELGKLTGLSSECHEQVIAAARSTGKSVLVTSVEDRRGIGAIWIDRDGAWLGLHDKHDDIPKGSGDLLAAMVMARLIEGLAPVMAVGSALSGVQHVIGDAKEWRAPELPIVGSQAAWDAVPVVMEPL